MPTCEAPGATVVKKTRSPGDSVVVSTCVPTRNCRRTSRGTDTPCCAKTYCTKPLQSKPVGVSPPSRYGAPLSASAVDEIEYPSVLPGGKEAEFDDGGALGAAGSVPPPPVGAPPGTGNGRGTAPVEAQPATNERLTMKRDNRGMAYS